MTNMTEYAEEINSVKWGLTRLAASVSTSAVQSLGFTAKWFVFWWYFWLEML